MGIDFRGINRTLRQQLKLWRLRAAIALINVIRFLIVKLGKPEDFVRNTWETHDQQQATIIRQALFTNIGHAHSAWAGIEEYLIAITGLLLRTHEATKVGTIMYSIISFPVWLRIIDELFSLEPLYSAQKPKWNKINKKLGRVDGFIQVEGRGIPKSLFL